MRRTSPSEGAVLGGAGAPAPAPGLLSGFDVRTDIELTRISTRNRLVYATLYAMASLVIEPWPRLVGWLAAVYAWEYVVRPAFERRIVRLAGSRGRQAYALLTLFGACLFSVMPLLGFMSRTSIGDAIATTWLAGSFMSALLYYGSYRPLRWACLAPMIAVAIGGPFLAFGVGLQAVAVGGLVLLFLASAREYALDHHTLRRTLAERQQAMSDVERKLAVAIEASGDGMFEIDLVTGEAVVSETWLRMLGYEPGEMERTFRNWRRFVHPEDQPELDSAYAAHFRGQTPHTAVEHRMICKNGEAKWVLARSRLVQRTEHGRPHLVVGTIMDLSSRKALEQQLEAARDAAEAANHAKGVFLANMSHEIRTPLNGVIGTAGALARRSLGAEEREMVSLIQASGRTLDRLLSDILDQAKIEAGQFELVLEPFDLHEEIETAAELMRARADEKGVAFRVAYGEAARGRFEGDAVRIRQIVSNLASNAIKFTTQGEVRIEVEVAEPQPKDSLTQLQVRVVDTGIGLAPDAAQRLFSRFTQADGSISRQFGGTGLGLAISKTLVELMGGQISVTSGLGEGSTFTVTIPLRRTMTLADYDAAGREGRGALQAPEPDAEVGRLKILLAEDHPTNQRVVQLILEPAGVDLTIVANGREALEAFRPGLFDVVLMDMQMPLVDGLTATREIRDIERRTGAAPTPIAMLTANAMREHLEQAAAAGADHLISKPITPESLTAGLEATLAKAASGAERARAS